MANSSQLIADMIDHQRSLFSLPLTRSTDIVLISPLSLSPLLFQLFLLPPPFFHDIWSSWPEPPSPTVLSKVKFEHLMTAKKQAISAPLSPSLSLSASLPCSFHFRWCMVNGAAFAPVTQPNCPPSFSSYPPGWSLSSPARPTLVPSVSGLQRGLFKLCHFTACLNFKGWSKQALFKEDKRVTFFSPKEKDTYLFQEGFGLSSCCEELRTSVWISTWNIPVQLGIT